MGINTKITSRGVIETLTSGTSQLSVEVPSVSFAQGLSGSLTQLSDGSSFLIAGDGVNIITGSNGAVTISSTGAAQISIPLFIALNIDSTIVWSNDGESWSSPTFLFSEDDIETFRLTVANNYIIYVGRDIDLDESGLWYAATVNQAPIKVNVPLPSIEGELPPGSRYEWRDAEYGNGFTVAVGSILIPEGEGPEINIPWFAYTSNGVTWFTGSVDIDYISASLNTSFSRVSFGNDGWLIVADIGPEAEMSAGGAFFITSPTQTLSEGNFIPFNGLEIEPLDLDADGVVWNGERWFIRLDNEDAKIIVSDGANPLTSDWTLIDLDSFAIENGFGTGIVFREVAGGQLGDGNYWFLIASHDGHVLATSDGGLTWVGSIPLPYTDTIDSATLASPCVISPSFRTLQADEEKIVISNAIPADFNGTYYGLRTFNDNDIALYLDVELSTPFDSTGFDPFVSGDITYSHGTYIDAVGYGLEKFIVGNDDEQLFASTDAETWTLVSDLEDAFDYWDDIGFNSTFATTGFLSLDQLINGVNFVKLETDGSLNFTNGGKISEGEVDELTTLELTPGNPQVESQRLVLKTGFIEDYHLHLTTGDAEQTSIFLGTDSQHVKIGALNGAVEVLSKPDSAVIINAPLISGEGTQDNFWIFSSNGVLEMPGATIQKTTSAEAEDGNFPLDITKSIHKLANSDYEYTLADGTEGQIIYLVPQTGATPSGVEVRIAKARVVTDGESEIRENNLFLPFSGSSSGGLLNVVTLIFTDGAWNLSTGEWD